jgi:hypothetical protein
LVGSGAWNGRGLPFLQQKKQLFLGLTGIISCSEFFGHEWRWGLSEKAASFGAFCEHGAVFLLLSTPIAACPFFGE